MSMEQLQGGLTFPKLGLFSVVLLESSGADQAGNFKKSVLPKNIDNHFCFQWSNICCK